MPKVESYEVGGGGRAIRGRRRRWSHTRQEAEVEPCDASMWPEWMPMRLWWYLDGVSRRGIWTGYLDGVSGRGARLIIKRELKRDRGALDATVRLALALRIGQWQRVRVHAPIHQRAEREANLELGVGLWVGLKTALFFQAGVGVCQGLAYMHTCIHTYIHAYMHTYIHTYIHAYIHAYTHAYIDAYIHACMHAYIQACMHRCIHTYIHTYIQVVEALKHSWNGQQAAIFTSSAGK